MPPKQNHTLTTVVAKTLMNCMLRLLKLCLRSANKRTPPPHAVAAATVLIVFMCVCVAEYDNFIAECKKDGFTLEVATDIYSTFR